MTEPADRAGGASLVTMPAALLAMHAGPQPLILPNVWDPVSARAFAEAGFTALATSSGAVAATLGYRDGQTPVAGMLAAGHRANRTGRGSRPRGHRKSHGAPATPPWS